jgi:hypothetical protein
MFKQTRYIESYRVECLSGTAVARPVHGFLHDGLVIGLRPTISRDRRYVTLELEGANALVRMPIKTDQIRILGSLHPLQRPRTELQSWRHTVRIPTGSSILIRGAFTPQGGKGVGIMVVTASALTITAGELMPDVDLKPGKQEAPAPPRVKRVGK